MRLRRNRGTVAERPAIETDEEPGAGDDAGTAPATTESTEPATSRSPAPQTRPAATAEPVAPAGEPGTPVGTRTRAARFAEFPPHIGGDRGTQEHLGGESRQGRVAPSLSVRARQLTP